MTWSELRGVLHEHGLITVVDGSDDAAASLVTGVAYDSRAVEPGNVFVALKGEHADGASFARDAIARGALAIVSEQAAPQASPVARAVVADARLALALLAAAFYRHPAASCRSSASPARTGRRRRRTRRVDFEAAGIRCGVLGTVAYRIGDEEREATHTTPERQTCSVFCARWSIEPAAPARWKCRRTRCRSAGPTR